MASLIPSIPPADGSRPGLLTHLAQVIGGVKTFLGLIVASAGIQVGSLFNTNGTGASDRVIQLGTSQPFAAANATAKLFSVWYGLGGVETEQLTLTKNGLYFNGYPNSAISCSGSWLQLGVLPVRCDSYFYSTQNSTAFYSTAGGAFSSIGTTRIWNEQGGAGASDIAIKAGFFVADGTVNPTAKLLSLRTGLGGTEVEKFSILKDGSLSSGGVVTGTGFAISTAPPLTAATGTPGATVTQNADKGRITVPAGATSVVVTNSAASANSFVSLTWEALANVHHSISYAAGSFTVTFSAALGSSLTFRYTLIR